MTYVLINHAPDGRHVRSFKTPDAALKALAKWFGRPADEFAVGKTYYSDWGNRLYIEERPAKWNARTEGAVAKAYDARECGEATKGQLALLAKHGF